MSFSCWEYYCLTGESAEGVLNEIASIGANWVSLTATWYQNTPNSSRIHRDSRKTISDDYLQETIDLAHQIGLKVMLKPHVDVLDGTWRGHIALRESQDIERWFSSYKEFILHYAKIASEHNVEQFCIGTEFVGMSAFASHWRGIVRDVRGHFRGDLTYAANFDEYQEIGFWDELDYAGINAYFPLTERADAPFGEIIDGWERWADSIEVWQAEVGRKVVVTEIGYSVWDGTSVEPWTVPEGAREDLQEQADSYRAALSVLSASAWLEGIFWWNWVDLDYSPKGKPAEAVLVDFWKDVIPMP